MYVCLSGYTVITHSLDSKSVRAQRFTISQVFPGTEYSLEHACGFPGSQANVRIFQSPLWTSYCLAFPFKFFGQLLACLNYYCCLSGPHCKQLH